MKGIRHNKLLTLISIIVLSCNAQSASAQTARISGSAVFLNGGTTTITGGSTTTTDPITGIITTVVPSTAQTVTTTGAITTVSAESSLPTGFYYSTLTIPTNPASPPAFVVVLPKYNSITLASGETIAVVESLSIGAGPVTAVGAANSFTQASAQILLQASGNVSFGAALTGIQVDSAAALIKAGAGVNGLE